MSPQTERMLTLAQELAQVGSWEYDPRSREAHWSAELYRILGLEPDAEPRGFEEIMAAVYPDDWERLSALIRPMIERPDDVPEEGVTDDLRMVRPDGEVREIRFLAMPERVNDHTVRLVGVVQDLTDERLSQRELQAHHALSEALREWESFDEGVMDLLRLVGTALEYDMGSLWLWRDEGGVLYCRAFWSAPGVEAAGYEYAKRSLTFRPGEGKPGKAWKEQQPVVTADCATDPGFHPREAAMRNGVCSGLAFPAVAEDGPVAVLSFYCMGHRVPSDSLVRTLTAVGRELGHFLSRRRADLGPRPLSNREIQIMRLAAEGNDGPQIAEQLFVAPATVKTHFENIYEKLGVSSRAAAVAHAIRLGLIV